MKILAGKVRESGRVKLAEKTFECHSKLLFPFEKNKIKGNKGKRKKNFLRKLKGVGGSNALTTAYSAAKLSMGSFLGFYIKVNLSFLAVTEYNVLEGILLGPLLKPPFPYF